MMQFSSWSEAESGVTMEVGVGESSAMCDGEDADALQRCVLPKAQPAFNISDQRVPVYRDQMVPVWPFRNQSEAATSKRNLAHTSSGVGHGEGRPSTYLRSSPGEDSSSEGIETEYNDVEGRRNSADGIGVSNVEVSFDDIMSIYQSSVLEKASQKWSRALRAILNHRSRKRHVYRPRLWRRFARNLDSRATVGISVQLKCSRLGHVSTDVEKSLLRSLQEAIERTSICDSSSSNSRSSGASLLPPDHAIFQVQRCDLEVQIQRRCDHLAFNTSMLTTGSS